MLTEALIGAVTEAVIERVANIAGVEDRLRQWLRRDPARLGFSKSFTRAYTAFARTYPDLAAALFDEHFLTTQAAPELAKLLTRHQHPDPATLAALWQAQFSADVPLITPAAGDFLNWLECELKQEEVFQPIFDSRALETLPALEAKVATLVQVLQQQAAQALQLANRYDIQTAGGSVIQGTVSASTFVGRDQNIYNNYFQGDFAALDDYYIRPDSVYQRVKVDEFMGRAWLIAQVDEFLNTPGRKSGALVLVGEAGVGKTAFLAHLASERRYLHLFGEQLSGEAKLPVAIRSLGAQLIARYRIEPYARRDAMPEAPSFYSSFLERLLRQAAGALTAGEKIVIVCDALDEAGAPHGDNVFGLPKDLPDGVFLILSQRPVAVPLKLTYPATTLKLETGSAENIADVAAFLQAVAQRPAIAQQLHAHGYQAADLVRTLGEKSAGVWMYLLYVIDEIEQGKRTPLNLAQLPTGLVGYYGQYWNGWRYPNPNNPHEAHPKWDSLYAPLLATLAAVQEPVTLYQLKAWAGVTASDQELRRILSQQWRAFVSEQTTASKAEVRYRLYHLSLRDFINGRVADEVQPTDAYLIEELRAQVKAAHQRVVDQYRTQCAGLWHELASTDDYARNYLVAHLKEVDGEAMFALVAGSDAWAKAREAHEGSYAGYLTDLEQAWCVAEQPENWNIGRQIRCGLIKSSIHALASNIPPELFALAVQAKIWSAARALAHIPSISGGDNRATALIGLAPYLPTALLAEALAVVWNIEDESWRQRSLAALAPHLPVTLLDEALHMACRIKGEYSRAMTLTALAPYLSVTLLNEALRIARAIDTESNRARALTVLVQHLPIEQQSVLVEEALHALRSIKEEMYWNNEILTALAPYLSITLLDEALHIARALEGGASRAEALSVLAQHLPIEQQQATLQEALYAARTIQDEHSRASALISLTSRWPTVFLDEALHVARSNKDEGTRSLLLTLLVPYMPVERQQALLEEALQVACSIHNEYSRARALTALAQHPSVDLHDEALRTARSVVLKDDGIATLTALARYLPVEQQQALLEEALQVARSINDNDSWTQTLAAFIPHLPVTLSEEALQIARSINDGYWRADALAALALHIPVEQRQAVLQEALQAVASINDSEGNRADALAKLAPSLSVSLLNEALQIAHGIIDADWRAKSLTALTPHLPREQQQDFLDEALLAARNINSTEYNRTETLVALAPHLPVALLDEALQTARSIKDEYLRAEALTVLAAYLPVEQQQALLEDELQTARNIKDRLGQMQALAALAPHLSVEQQQAILEELPTARGWLDWSRSVKALAALVPYLSAALFTKALHTACTFESGVNRAKALTALAPHLPIGLFEEAIQEARSLSHENDRAEVLIAFAPRLPVALFEDTLQEARRFKSGYNRARILTALVSHQPAEQRQELLEEALKKTLSLEAGRSSFDLRDRRSEVLTIVLTQCLVVAQTQFDFSSDSDAALKTQAVGAIGYSWLRSAIWMTLMYQSATQPRTAFLSDLRSLIPLIRYLGGTKACGEAFQALKDVPTWWP